ncbi:MAG: YhdT family protein [Lachnospiraceae bacterium]|nr:YhdT family protein [Lachnospiraceae bacterium]
MKEKEVLILTEEEKHRQMMKEIKATFILIFIVAAWHIGFGFGLNGTDVMILGMPLWFFVSTIGAFIISVVGVIILLKFVFVNFELGDEEDDQVLYHIEVNATIGNEVTEDE